CKKEMPMLEEVQKKYAARGVVVVGISADANAGIAAKFARKLKVNYRLLIDPTLMTSDAEATKFGFVGLPTTFVVDRNGVIRGKVIGFTYITDLDGKLDDVLGKD